MSPGKEAMVTDITQISANLLSFYDFSDKDVVSVGAGGGQMIEYARSAKKVLAVDSDPGAIEKLEEQVRSSGLADRFHIIQSDFESTDVKGDVVLFEFCLHEMKDPAGAIARARSMAPDLVIIDHLPESEWAYYAAEERQVRDSWDAVLACAIRIRGSFSAAQCFRDYEDLQNRVRTQGEESLRRIKRFAQETDIVIRMPYGIVLI